MGSVRPKIMCPTVGLSCTLVKLERYHSLTPKYEYYLIGAACKERGTVCGVESCDPEESFFYALEHDLAC